MIRLDVEYPLNSIQNKPNIDKNNSDNSNNNDVKSIIYDNSFNHIDNNNNNNNNNDNTNTNNNKQISYHLQANYNNLKNIQNKLEVALNEIESIHSQRIMKYIT
jgi:hypothetical protein